jgi:hypothetical protein
VPGGRFELPSKPESFRGCSTTAMIDRDRRIFLSFSFLLDSPGILQIFHLLFRYNLNGCSQTLGCCCVTADMLCETRVQINAGTNVMPAI